MATTPRELDAVTKAARKYERAQRARDAALVELLGAIRAADKAGGVTRSQLVDASGLARQTVYDALQKQAAQQTPS